MVLFQVRLWEARDDLPVPGQAVGQLKDHSASG